MTDQSPPPKESWHLDKRIPIALIITLLSQFAAVIGYISKLDARVDQQSYRIERLEASDREQTGKIATSSDGIIRLQEQSAHQTRLLEQIVRQLARETRP